MNNPILQSESFERAAYTLRQSFEVFQRNGFDESVTAFCRAVEKMARIAGMQAENDQRKHRGEAMAYTEGDFSNV